MAYSNINLNEGTKTMYLYRAKANKDMDISISVTEVKMDKWRETKGYPNVKTTEYYRPIPNQKIRVSPVDVQDLGKIYHGTDMILDRVDENYYLKALIAEYQERADKAKKSVERFENYTENLLSKIK